MERHLHTIGNLFAQLGLPSEAAAIAQFLDTYRPLASDVQLHEAVFWSSSQSNFLREALLDDADWVDVVEELNAELHVNQ